MGDATARPHGASIEAVSDKLAMEKSYVVGLAAAAFFAGAGGAVLYSFRRRPPRPNSIATSSAPIRFAAPQKEAAVHAEGHAVATAARGITRPTHVVAPPKPYPRPSASADQHDFDDEAGRAPLSDAAKQGPLAIFREMNAAIFSSMRSSGPVNRPLGQSVSTTLPTTAAGGLRLANTASVRAAPSTQALGVLQKTPRAVVDDDPPPSPEESARSDGPLMAFGAFTLATALVGGVTAAVTLGIRHGLGITSVEELADYIHEYMPRLGRQSTVTRYLPVVPPQAHEEDEEPDTALSPDEVVDRLKTTDDPVEWVHLARLRLQTELNEHRAQREARRLARMQS